MTTRMTIEVVGFDKKNTVRGKATRILASATSKEFITDNIAQVKSSIKVGQCGKHVVTLMNDDRTIRRVDAGRRGTIAAQIGEFEDVK